MQAIVWCSCPYDTNSHLHGSWCATTREGGASVLPYDMNGDIARGQHGQHIASVATQRSSLALTSDDVYEGESTQDGGAREWVVLEGGEWLLTGQPDVYTYDAVHEDEADSLPVNSATWYPNEPTHSTWLERMARRWPARVS